MTRFTSVIFISLALISSVLVRLALNLDLFAALILPISLGVGVYAILSLFNLLLKTRTIYSWLNNNGIKSYFSASSTNFNQMPRINKMEVLIFFIYYLYLLVVTGYIIYFNYQLLLSDLFCSTISGWGIYYFSIALFITILLSILYMNKVSEDFNLKIKINWKFNLIVFLFTVLLNISIILPELFHNFEVTLYFFSTLLPWLVQNTFLIMGIDNLGLISDNLSLYFTRDIDNVANFQWFNGGAATTTAAPVNPAPAPVKAHLPRNYGHVDLRALIGYQTFPEDSRFPKYYTPVKGDGSVWMRDL